MSFPIGTESDNAVSTALKKGRTGWTCGNPYQAVRGRQSHKFDEAFISFHSASADPAANEWDQI